MVRISMGMFENATKSHCLDLKQLGHRASTACQFQGILTDLKDQLGRKASMRRPLVLPDRLAELAHNAA